MPVNDKSWIIATGQVWKLYLALMGFLCTLIFFTLAMYSLVTGGDRFAALTVCGLFLGAATFLWMTLALRCPHCSTKLVLKMFATRPHTSWLIDLAALDHCPVCRRLLTATSWGRSS